MVFRYLVRVKRHLQRGQINAHVHEYLRNPRYEYCNSCKTRTQFTCIKCGFCWSCHWLKEEMERISPYLTPIEV
jgi:anaerobic ribonucleoside-triphosphate reductase